MGKDSVEATGPGATRNEEVPQEDKTREESMRPSSTVSRASHEKREQ